MACALLLCKLTGREEVSKRASNSLAVQSPGPCSSRPRVQGTERLRSSVGFCPSAQALVPEGLVNVI